MDKNEEILFQLQRTFASTGRNILNILEDLKAIHDNNFNKLYSNLPKDLYPIIDLANYFDDNRMSWIRGKIFDTIMQAKRDLERIVTNDN
jgi:hypothetical protein